MREIAVRLARVPGGVSTSPDSAFTDGEGIASLRVFVREGGGPGRATILAGGDSVGVLSYVGLFPLEVRTPGDGRGRAVVRKGSATVLDCIVSAVPPSSCKVALHLGDTVTVTATPEPGSSFVGFLQPPSCDQQQTCTVVITGSIRVSAGFYRWSASSLRPEGLAGQTSR